MSDEEINKDGVEGKVDETESQYEAQIRELREQKEAEAKKAENYRKALEEERGKAKEEEAEPKEVPAPAPTVDVDSLKKELMSGVDEKLNRVQMDMVATTFTEELEGLSGSEKERELIREHYQRSIRPSGLSREAIRRDLQLCKAAANLSRLSMDDGSGQTVKFTSALAGGGSQPKGMESDSGPKLTEAEERFVSKMSKVAKSYTP